MAISLPLPLLLAVTPVPVKRCTGAAGRECNKEVLQLSLLFSSNTHIEAEAISVREAAPKELADVFPTTRKLIRVASGRFEMAILVLRA